MSDSAVEPSSLSPEGKRRLLGRLMKHRAARASVQGGTSAPPALSADRFEPFPLRDIQQAYWIGRGQDFELGNVGAHVYVEFDSPRLDLARLGAALNALIRRHDMLRAVVLPDGQQKILQEVPPYDVAVLDLSAATPETVVSELDVLRTRLSHLVLPADRWPLFDLRVTVLPGAKIRIHFGIDLLVADLRSIYILLAEWFQLYVDPDIALPSLGMSFREYVLRERAQEGTEAFTRAEAYWRAKLSDLPPAPELPLLKSPASVTSPRFSRRTARLRPQAWAMLKERAAHHNVTPASVLLAAFGRTLATWSRSPRLTVDVTIFNRLPLHPDVNHLVGDFTSVVLVGIDHSERESFSARCARTNEQLWEALDHREFSGVRVLRELLRTAGGMGRAIMPVVFTCDLRHDMVSIKDSGSKILPGEIAYGVSQTPQVYLDHQVFEEGGGLTINWDAVEDLFPQGLLDEMLAANMGLLEELARSGQSWNDPSGSLIPESHSRMALAVNATDAPIATDLLHELFARQVSRDPDAVAVVSGGRSLTYGELSERANGIGRRLRDSGTRPNALVAVVMEKGWEQVAAVMGVLCAGGAYLPVDPDLPVERLHYMLEHGQIRVVLTQSRIDRRLQWPDGIERLRVDEDVLTGAGAAPLAPVQQPDDLAYVIYTSGSTGLPKGVMIDHRGAVNTVLDINDRFSIGPGDRVLALSSLSFDLSVYDIFGALSAGATIVVPDMSAAADPAAWVDLIRREKVTIWNSVPAMMEMLVDYAFGRSDRAVGSLRLVLMSGDWVPVSLPDRIKALVEGVSVVSLGGATEASIWSILYPVEETAPEWESIPYGKPMRNQRFHVLDELLDPRPVGVPGELYIGGIGLSKGYWGDEERTAARFIVHPRTLETLYRTGDWGVYFRDGNIKFLGREDSQVKIQGYRVELGEIEAALREHPGVRAAVATAAGERQGAKRLSAYVVCDAEPGPADTELKDFLRGKLPQYMVPSSIVKLAAFPLTANGKVDRSALPSASLPAARNSEGPATPIASRLNALITNALHVESVDMNANLTDLGANSLDMLRIGNLLEQEFGFRPTMQEFFRFPNLAGLANYYERRLAGSGSGGEPQVPDSDPASRWRSFRLLVDPRDRTAFKKSQPGLRKVDESPFLQLQSADPDQALAIPAFARRSHRAFEHGQLDLEQFGAFLSCLRQVSPELAKRQYASAGGLYPVQAYLHVKGDRIDGVPTGTYYYDPRDHRLVPLSGNVLLDRTIHWPENQLIFDEAAFSIFLIVQLSAIAPLYQEKSLHFAAIEAGLISQLLEMSAPSCGLGLCHVGDLAFEPVRRLFALEESHVLVHSLLGGAVDPARDPAGEESEDPTVTGAQSFVAPALDGAALTPVNVSELLAEAVLDPVIRAGGPTAVAATPSRIFLTGATGFLGAFLLQELLEQTGAGIHCLVRASTPAEGLLRLRRNLERYELWNEAMSARIVPVLGDLAEPGLGLEAEEFDDLAATVDAIYHNGAMVNLLRPYADLKASNVGGTHEVLRLASRNRPKPVHYVSSVAVFPFEGGKVRRELDPLDHGESLVGGYAQSKWVAEQLVAQARSRGLPVCVYRPGTITGHSRTGIFSNDSYMNNMIRGCIELGSAPDIDAPVDMVPVDYVARAIVALSLRPESPATVFHLTNPRPISMSGLIDFMDTFGYTLRRVSYESWRQELLSLGGRFESNALFPFGAFIAQRAEGSSMGPQYDCEATINALTGTSVVCPEADDTLLRVYFSRYVSSGFLEQV